MKKNLNKTCIKVTAELECNTTFIQSLFSWKGREMYILILIIVAMLSSFFTLLLHCCVLLGKERDKNWEEDQITKNESKKE